MSTNTFQSIVFSSYVMYNQLCNNLNVHIITWLIIRYLYHHSGTLIIHETWDEPDSRHPDGVSSVDSLHRSGQEAVISISTPLEDISLNERNYSSDNSLLETLATMAVCVGFDYVRINTANNTVSVAVRECVTNDTR